MDEAIVTSDNECKRHQIKGSGLQMRSNFNLPSQ